MASPAYAHSIWYERYRPKVVADLVLEPAVRQVFDSFVEQKDFPHLLLYGPPGSGKTTIAQILIAKADCIAITLNASSEDRGIETMKTKVPNFAKSAPPMGKSFKVVFLDEADNLTPDAQKALKNTIETYSKNCRFILTANHIDKVNEALRSRCTMFEFSSFPKRSMVRSLKKIMEAEKVTFDINDVTAVVDRYYPDYRTIINNLQIGSIGGTFVPRNAAALNVDPAFVAECILSGKLRAAREHWAGMSDFVWLYRFLFEIFVPGLPEDKQGEAMITIAQYAYQDAYVADREIQFTGCCASLSMLLGKKPSMK